MNADKLIITLFAEDEPGVLQKVSDTVLEHDGNWLESSLSRLCGQFAGIVHLAVGKDKKAALKTALEGLAAEGISVSIHDKLAVSPDELSGTPIEVIVEANDRPGIIDEIASALADVNVNIEQMETACESASMAGYQLFIANLLVALPPDLSVEEFEEALEKVSDDLIVSIVADDE
ncbi:MAG: ACT domain-containing protein [Pseudomonadota bacterium]